MHIEYLSNGMGSQSMLLLYLAATKQIPATVSITSDTGGEDDCLLSTGERCTARQFFGAHIKPYAERHDIQAYHVRVVDKNKKERESLPENVMQHVADRGCAHIPAYGSRGGQLNQTCTVRWKTDAINQQLRRIGAKTARGAIGIHAGEAPRRYRGSIIRQRRDGADFTTFQNERLKWLTHYYPLCDLGIYREQTREILQREGIVYVQHSQCYFCPHQDYQRWSERSPEYIDKAVAMENAFNGEFFLTNRCKPLLIALEEMKREDTIRKQQGNLFDEVEFGCENDVCGI